MNPNKILEYLKNLNTNFSRSILNTYNEFRKYVIRDIVDYNLLPYIIWNNRIKIISHKYKNLLTDIEYYDSDYKDDEFVTNFNFSYAFYNIVETFNDKNNETLKNELNSFFLCKIYKVNDDIIDEYDLALEIAQQKCKFDRIIFKSVDDPINCTKNLSRIIKAFINIKNNIDHLLNFIEITTYKDFPNQFKQLKELLNLPDESFMMLMQEDFID